MLRYRRSPSLPKVSKYTTCSSRLTPTCGTWRFLQPEPQLARIPSCPLPLLSTSTTFSTDNTIGIVSRSAKASAKPRAVIFDLGGVIVPSPQVIFDRFEEKHGLEAGSLVSTIKGTGNGGAFAKLERGEYTVEQFCEPFRSEYLSHTRQELSKEQAWEFIQQLSDFTKLTPNPSVLSMFQKLKSQDIKVAILTNNFRWDSGRSVFPREKLNVDVVSHF